MAPYSIDLRKRVLRAWDSGMDAESVATKYEVSRAWVHRLVQRRRETCPRKVEESGRQASIPRQGGRFPDARPNGQEVRPERRVQV